MESPALILNTVLLRPYVFVFLAAFLFSAVKLLGWPRTWRFWIISWITAFICEFSSTRNGVPFGWYHYTGSTVGQELYISNIPFIDSLSFSFLLYASYCLALVLLLPADQRAKASSSPVLLLAFDRDARTSPPIVILTVLFFVMIDMVIDPVALRGDRWFLGRIYYYPEPGVHFGVPIANYVGWAVVGMIAMLIYRPLDRRLATPLPSHRPSTTGVLLLGCGLYFGVLAFNLSVTFWIGEALQGTTGLLLYLPVAFLFLFRVLLRTPA